MLSPPQPAQGKRPSLRRLHVLLIAFATLAFHLWLAAKLASFQDSLGTTLGDSGGGARGGDDARDLEGAEWRRLDGVRTLLGIGRLWAWCSVGIACIGVWGLAQVRSNRSQAMDAPLILVESQQDHLPFVRLFMLNSFLSLALDTFLVILVILLLTLSSPTSASLATTLCQALSSAPSASSSFSLSFGLPDLLGLSLEACEERFEGVVVSALATLAVVEGLRGWGAVKVLQFYAALVQRKNSGRHARQGSEEGRRRGRGEGDDGQYYDSPVELESGPALHRSPSGRKRRTESDAAERRRRERSSSGASLSGGGNGQKRHEKETRIFLLPRPEERSGGRAARQEGAAEGVPLLSLTASSPVRSSFPPPPKQGHGSSHLASSGRRVLVYAPVMVSPEEARSLGATELVLQGGRPPIPRSHSHHAQPSASSSASSSGRSARSRSSTITPSSATLTAAPSSSHLSIDTTRGSPPSRQDSDGLRTPIALHSPAFAAALREDWEGEPVKGSKAA
ncbi:hypothetical protein AAT19DRAFT_12510 [Rhodotorula toruloides]|uniref:Uncharacterized protein n=1 Tax=Rhodotorula toruloides TaxID=5286 RepID=A0A2T0AGG8_RHOTO|nr:hypothetical protein AAT19DRAFT_12510 [Rhodotorula toruloides]